LNFATIAIFAFNRPKHLEKLLMSLVANPGAQDSKVIIFVDGPRESADQMAIESVILTIERFKQQLDIDIVKNLTNRGLSNSVLAGIDSVLESYDSIIVLEDDLVLANTFLKFCNEGLTIYRNCPLIASVQGYSPILLDEGKGTYFLKGADCWGWATWKDRWLTVERDSSVLLKKIEESNLSFKFDLNGSFPYTDMLRREARKEVDSWAIRWHASMFLQNRLSVYPNKSLVLNTGFDGSGTHRGNFLNDEVLRGLANTDFYPEFDTITPKESKVARSLIIKLSRKRYKSYPYWHPLGLPRFAARKLKNLLLYLRGNKLSRRS
jgi:hypothetical protein